MNLSYINFPLDILNHNGENFSQYLGQNKQYKRFKQHIIKKNKNQKKQLRFDTIPSLLGNQASFKYLEKDYSDGINVGMLALAPYETVKLKNVNVCEHATNGCKKACLGVSFATGTNFSRIKRTILFKEFQNYFFNRLFLDIYNHVVQSIKNEKIPVIRLNGFSDIPWENEEYKFVLNENIAQICLKNQLTIDYSSLSTNKEVQKLFIKYFGSGQLPVINQVNIGNKTKSSFFDFFHNILFYDYTKYPQERFDNIENIKNYYLTFSRHEDTTESQALKFLNSGININLVATDDMYSSLKDKTINLNNDTFNIIDGNKYDCRFLDLIQKTNNRGLLTIQKVTRRGKADNTGFVISTNNGLKLFV